MDTFETSWSHLWNQHAAGADILIKMRNQIKTKEKKQPNRDKKKGRVVSCKGGEVGNEGMGSKLQSRLGGQRDGPR